MHHHGYLWLGEKRTFDRESVRRPAPQAPGAGGDEEVRERHREAVAAFPMSEVPPLQTSHWLLKPPALVRGTWAQPRDAGRWLGERLAEVAPRFAGEADRSAGRLARLVDAAVERLARGGDVSLGHYLRGTLFHSVALVTCSPNRAAPGLPCPTGGHGGGAGAPPPRAPVS
ncbi:hypothetical protein [Streptomyces triticirhizae]|uniref:Uncharacterized protein n=1 Tax=Streptomyces triticirhizae TaxID=2483353 RepID=A0A3M2LV31_9ACTN|nr:hypothetical protein [Streptomyces triticirhizae]RMI38798.1 hypothetical protein EBN88_16125 [Streptomyces triticirhizae]